VLRRIAAFVGAGIAHRRAHRDAGGAPGGRRDGGTGELEAKFPRARVAAP
jgi:hypothetical protein